MDGWVGAEAGSRDCSVQSKKQKEQNSKKSCKLFSGATIIKHFTHFVGLMQKGPRLNFGPFMKISVQN